MTGQENVLVMLPKSELEQIKGKLDELLSKQKQESPLDGYVSKSQVQDLYGFSDRTWSRLKSKGLIRVKKLGGLQFVRADEFVQAIEEGTI
jgi:hypothetical protein